MSGRPILNTWGPEHHLTQGLCLSGSTAEGDDRTNRLTWLFVEGATNLTLPEPLIWIRWHPNIDQEFFDFCLSRLLRSTCFPMMWNDNAIPAALMELGVAREDAFKGRVAVLEDYDINLARHLVQGVDVWLNTPRRPLEASGTSGQKVVLNGGLNCSVLDGWWAEAYDGQNGFAIGTGRTRPAMA